MNPPLLAAITLLALLCWGLAKVTSEQVGRVLNVLAVALVAAALAVLLYTTVTL